MKTTLAEYLEQIDLGKSLSEIAVEAAKAVSGKLAEEATTSVAKELGAASLTPLVLAVSGEAAKALVGGIAGSLLKALLGASDKVSAKLDKFDAAPLQTGARVAREALALPARDEAEVRVRDRRFDFAIEQLDTAWTHAEGHRHQDQERFFIRLLQGLCAIHKTGGGPLARVRLSECIQWLQAEEAPIASRLHDLPEEVETAQREFKKALEIRPRDQTWESTRISVILGQDLQKLEEELSLLSARHKRLTAMIETLNAILPSETR